MIIENQLEKTNHGHLGSPDAHSSPRVHGVRSTIQA
jgi:hypothetical protein